MAGLGHTLSNTAKDKDSPELLSLGKWQGPQERADECSGLRKDQETLLGGGEVWKRLHEEEEELDLEMTSGER